MPGRTVLFGATGYTGRLVAEAMLERGMRPVLAARGREGLEALAAELGGGLETAVADVSDPTSVRSLVERGDVLVTTVGPFARWGGPAAAAAST
ncbi:MAG: NAD(P)H-binding protein, partial [Thermoleophilaceae bacterium]